MPGPLSSTTRRPSAISISIGPPLGSNLAALSTRLEIARSSAGGGASTDRAVDGHGDGATVAPPGAVGDDRGESAEGDRLRGGLVGQPARQGDDLLDQADQLLGLGVQVVEHLGPRRRVEVGMAPQHGEVGAHARQRRAQLVTGVLDEAALVVARRGERTEHPVEGVTEAPDLVVAADGHLDVEPAGPLDVGGRPGQADQRPGHRAGDQPAEGGRGDGHQARRAGSCGCAGRAARPRSPAATARPGGPPPTSAAGR